MKKQIFCLFLLLLKYSDLTCEGANLLCYPKRSVNRFVEASLSKPESLIRSGCIQLNRTTLVFTFGFLSKYNGTAANTVLTAILVNTDSNILLLNWGKEAANDLLIDGVTYALSALPKAMKIGEQFGEALILLKGCGLNLKNVHLIGHSVGAHIMAKAARFVQKHSCEISRITGLDPAAPFFENPPVFPKLDKSCASFVDIIHTDTKKYGVKGLYGHVDICTNPYDEVQPGCPKQNTLQNLLGEVTSSSTKCSHNRGWMYFAESYYKPDKWPAITIEKFHNHTDGIRPRDITYLGKSCKQTARGVYALTTNCDKPFGLGEAGI